jgi:hypothetical protein
LVLVGAHAGQGAAERECAQQQEGASIHFRLGSCRRRRRVATPQRPAVERLEQIEGDDREVSAERLRPSHGAGLG